jgi:hypothetical protein
LLQKWESRISSPSNLELVSRPFLVFFFACPPAADVYTPEPEGKLSNSFYLGHGQSEYVQPGCPWMCPRALTVHDGDKDGKRRDQTIDWS